MPCSRDQHDQGRRCLQVDMASQAQSRTGSVSRRPEPTPIGENHPTFVSDGLYSGPAGSATASRHAGFFLYALDLQQGARITAINSSSSAWRTGDCDHFGRCTRKLKVDSRTDPEERKIYTRPELARSPPCGVWYGCYFAVNCFPSEAAAGSAIIAGEGRQSSLRWLRPHARG